MAKVHFHEEDVALDLSKSNQSVLKKWILNVAVSEGFKVDLLNYIFTSDDYLLSVNKQFLNHDYYTDIITFNNAEKKGVIEGDIYISLDRVKENATAYKVTFEDEFKRVLVHGLLHLCGYSDKNNEQQAEMRSKENAYLSLQQK